MSAITTEAPHAPDRPPAPDRARAPGRIRASDAEREHVAQILRDATGAGLLDLEEVEQRLAACYAARYRTDLEPLTADLPGTGRLPAGTAQARAAARRGLRRHAVLVAALAGLLVVAWALSDVAFFWPIWPIAVLVFTLFRHGRRIHWGVPA